MPSASPKCAGCLQHPLAAEGDAMASLRLRRPAVVSFEPARRILERCYVRGRRQELRSDALASGSTPLVARSSGDVKSAMAGGRIGQVCLRPSPPPLPPRPALRRADLLGGADLLGED